MQRRHDHVIKTITILLHTQNSVGSSDKKAVAMGGGLTHRLNLSDGILVKDNHFLFLPLQKYSAKNC